MNALADAAFLTSPDSGYNHGYDDAQLETMGAVGMAAAIGNGSSVIQASMGLPGGVLRQPTQLPGPGRHLQILDHTVHRIDTHTKHNGEEEKEMVVSNLRHFTLKIGVLDPRIGLGRESELPLKAELLYENGQLVEQLATCEPLLVGKTEVVAMQGSALFKLRITSLSSHRDKQRFRIRVSPTDTNLLLREPGLSVVTTPMKCVTKLSHRTGGTKLESEEAEEETWEESTATLKRKRDDIDHRIEHQGQQLEELQQTTNRILEQLRALREMLSAQLPKR